MLVSTGAEQLHILLVMQISFDRTTKMLRKLESMILHSAEYRQFSPFNVQCIEKNKLPTCNVNRSS